MRTKYVTLLAFTLLSTARAVTVYLHPPPTGSADSLPQLDAPHASFALARHLGLERFESSASGESFQAVWQEGQEGLVGTAARDGLLVSMTEEEAKALLPSNMEPTFELPGPDMDSLQPLIQTYVHRASDLYSNVYSMLSTSFSNQWSPLLNTFSAPTEANRAFLESTDALVHFLDSTSFTTSSPVSYENFGAFEINGLRELAEQYGTDSESYKTALRTLKVVFQTAMERQYAKLAVVTFSGPAVSSKRADPPQSPLPSVPQPAEPVSDISNCFTSAQACSNATDSCSGHGECLAATKLGRTCYVCACSASVDEQGRKDEWAGAACERKDISGPFVLLGGTVVVLILLIAGSVALLSGIGSQELPSTLTGTVSVGHKRD